MTTGKVATPELVSAVRPIEATVPVTGPGAPSVVIKTIEEVELPEPDPLPLSPPPDPPDPVPLSPPPDPVPLPPPLLSPPPDPLTCWPTVSPTVATMPSIGEV